MCFTPPMRRPQLVETWLLNSQPPNSSSLADAVNVTIRQIDATGFISIQSYVRRAGEQAKVVSNLRRRERAELKIQENEWIRRKEEKCNHIPSHDSSAAWDRQVGTFGLVVDESRGILRGESGGAIRCILPFADPTKCHYAVRVLGGRAPSQ